MSVQLREDGTELLRQPKSTYHEQKVPIRAKCKVCKDTIQTDGGAVYCECKEIFVTGHGLVGARDMSNLIHDQIEEGMKE